MKVSTVTELGFPAASKAADLFVSGAQSRFLAAYLCIYARDGKDVEYL